VSDGDKVKDDVRMLEAAPKKRAAFEEAVMSGGLGQRGMGMGNLREKDGMPGVYEGYVRNPPMVGVDRR